MAVELLNSIPELAWTLNPLRVEMRSDLKIEQAGQLYVGYIGFWNVDRPASFEPPPAGSVITVQMYGITQQFTFRNDAIMGNNELPVYNPAITGAAWIASLRDFFLSNSAVSSYYTITVTNYIERHTNPGDIVIRDSPPYLRFESKEAEDRATIEFYGEEVGLIVSTYVIGVSPVYRQNLKIYVELWVYDGVDINRLLAVNMPTDQSGKATVDISNLLHMHASLHIAEQSATAGVVRYYLSYTDVYGEQQVSGNIKKTVDKYALYGGVPISCIGESVSDSLVKDGLIQWLSPKDLSNEVVVRDQEYILTLFNPLATMANVKVCAMLNYSHGGYHEIEIRSINVLQNQKIYIDAMEVERLNPYPNEELISWAIYLKKDDVNVSANAVFTLHAHYVSFIRFFKYCNSFGAISFLNIYGKGSNSYDIANTKADILNSNGLAELRETSISLRNKEVLRTGYKSKKEIESMRDFFLSKEKYLKVGERWQSILVKTSEIKEFEDGNNLYALEFEIEWAVSDNVWGYK